MGSQKLKNKATKERLEESQLATLVELAMVPGETAADKIRQGVSQRIKAKQQDPKFLARIEGSQKRYRAL